MAQVFVVTLGDEDVTVEEISEVLFEAGFTDQGCTVGLVGEIVGSFETETDEED